MKNIRIISFISVLVVIFIILALCFKFLTVEETIKGTLLGAVVSIAVTLPFEINNYRRDENLKMDEFFWQWIAPYIEDMEHIFNNIIKLNDIGENLFDGISRSERNWEKYRNCYLDNKTRLDPLIKEFIELILYNGEEYNLIVLKLSNLISKLEFENSIRRKNKRYDVCYSLYNWVEHINTNLIDAYKEIKKNNTINDSLEKYLRALIVYRWLAYVYSNNYRVEIIEESYDRVTKEVLKTNVEAKIEYDKLFRNFYQVRYNKNPQ